MELPLVFQHGIDICMIGGSWAHTKVNVSSVNIILFWVPILKYPPKLRRILRLTFPSIHTIESRSHPKFWERWVSSAVPSADVFK